MYRFILRMFLIMGLVITLFGCSQTPKPYTLRVVFDGLVVMKEPKTGAQPTWILVGNASVPSTLTVGKKIPPHMSHLLVRVKAENGTEEAQVSGRNLGPPQRINELGLTGLWRGTMLNGEDLSLDAKTANKIELVRDNLTRDQPCNSKHWYFFCWNSRSRHQRENLSWTANLRDALEKLPGNAWDKQFKDCLTQDVYSCTEDPILLNARFRVDKGRLIVNKLIGQRNGIEVDGDLPKFLLVSDRHPLSNPRAQAEEIAIELELRDSVQIRSRSLNGSGENEALEIKGRPGQTVEVRIGNHPICDRTTCPQFTDDDFIFDFNYLNNPLFVETKNLPVPVEQKPQPGTNFNGQCSPATH